MDLGDSVKKERRPERTKAEAEEAVRVLLEYIGENPLRDGLWETRESFAHGQNIVQATQLTAAILKTFENPENILRLLY